MVQGGKRPNLLGKATPKIGVGPQFVENLDRDRGACAVPGCTPDFTMGATAQGFGQDPWSQDLLRDVDRLRQGRAPRELYTSSTRAGMMVWEAYARSDAGPVREHNEDSHLIDVDNGLFIVADGMGGHAFGEVASRLATDIVHRTLVGERDPEETRLQRPGDEPDPADVVRERMRYAMNQASLLIRKESEQRPERRGMGTTLVVLALDGEQAHLAHVGDSRAYLWRRGRLQRLTRDHTVVQQEVDAGRLTPELARLLPHKHILTQSVGFHGPVEPDTSTRMVDGGDVFILCSDGLTDPMDDVALQAVLHEVPSDQIANVLVEEALRRGTEDNVTVVAVFARD